MDGGGTPHVGPEKELCGGLASAQPDVEFSRPHLSVPAVAGLCMLAKNNSNDFHFIATSILGSQDNAPV